MASSQSALRKRNTEYAQQDEVKKAHQVRKSGGYDYTLLFLVIFMFAIGLLFIYSGSQYTTVIEGRPGTYYFMRQLTIGGGGLVGALLLSALFDYRILKKRMLPLIIYAGSVILLVLTLVLGYATNGKTRWISIAGVSFQPAEVAKLGIIIMLACICEKEGRKLKNLKNLLGVACLGGIPAILILTQNISSAFIVMAIVVIMLFAASGNYAMFGGLSAIMIAGILAAKPILQKILTANNITKRPSQYWLRRIYAWALPDVFATDSYQTMQGLYAIGSGGVTGRGLGESIQKFGKIPEVQNDMIFSVICEEFGFIGAAAVIILYIAMLYRIMVIARNARDKFGSLICVGVMAHIGVQVILNLSVVTGVIPNTGVTLPFISYGGTAVLLTMAEMGLVLSISKRSGTF